MVTAAYAVGDEDQTIALPRLLAAGKGGVRCRLLSDVMALQAMQLLEVKLSFYFTTTTAQRRQQSLLSCFWLLTWLCVSVLRALS